MDSPAEQPRDSTDEESLPTLSSTPEDLPSRLQSIVRSLQASPRAFRRAIDARLRGGLSEAPPAPSSPSLGRRLISRLLPAAAAATPSSVASSGGEEESYGGPCSSSSSSAPTSSGQTPPTQLAGISRPPPPGKPGDVVVAADVVTSSTSSPTAALHPMSVPEIVLQAPEAPGGSPGEEEEECGGGGVPDGEEGTVRRGGGKSPPLPSSPHHSTTPSPSGLESGTKLLTLVVCSGGGGGGSGGSSTVVDGGGSEGSVVAAVGVLPGAEGGSGGEGVVAGVVPARKSPVTVQEWVDSLPHSGATTPVPPHEASHSGSLLCRSEDEEGEERTGSSGEGASAAQSDMVEDGLSLGAEAGHLYSGCVPDEVMCPHQPSSEPSPATPAAQTSRRERSGGGSSATAKRREAFAGRRDADGVTEAGGGGSFQSDSHSPASHSSIDSLLESRRPDPEEMLFGLGFGGTVGGTSHTSQGSGGGGPGSLSGSQRGSQSPFPFGSCGNDGGSDDEVSRIPRRFLQPSKVKGVAINDFFKYQQDLIETFESGFCGYRGLTGPSHTVPSVIVAKIMEKLREHERENSSRGSVTSFGTGPMCQSPTPPPTPPFSPTSPMVSSPLEDERLQQFLHHHQPNTLSPLMSPVESQPITTKFSKVARNVMHRTSILTRMSSGGGESVASGDDASGIACSPTTRASLSVLTPDNRKFLDSQGNKSPEMPRKRMIIGQRSFTFDNDGDLIEDLTPLEAASSPALPPKPPLVHKDSVISSVTSLTSCDSDSDTDSAPNFRRSTSTRSPGARTLMKSRVSGESSSESVAPLGPWPLGKRMSSTSLSSWEEMGDVPGSSSHFGQRPRFLSIDEGDDESMEVQEEDVRRELWTLGDIDENGKEEWLLGKSKHGSECGSHTMETSSSENGSHLLASDKMEVLSKSRENSVQEGLWELELDQNEAVESDVFEDPPKGVPSSSCSTPLLDPLTMVKSCSEVKKSSEVVKTLIDVVKMEDSKSAIVESDVSLGVLRNSGEEGLHLRKGEGGSESQDLQMPSVSSVLSFSPCSSVQDASISSFTARRGSLKRQTKFEVEDESEVVDSICTDMAVDTSDETPRAATPNSHSGEVSTAEPSQQVSEVSSVIAEPVATDHSSSAVKMEEASTVAKREDEFPVVKEEERPKRVLSPHGRSGSAHSDSSGFLEWETPGGKVPTAPISPPLRPAPPTSLGVIEKEREWTVAEESSQLSSPDGGTTLGSSGYYGVEGLSSEMTGHQLPTDALELALSTLRRNLVESDGGQDIVGREVALGGSTWRAGGLAEINEGPSMGLEEETLQLAHQELGFVREMRCCVSEGMERVMQFLGTWGKHRLSPHHMHVAGTDSGDSAKVSSIMSQMTFLLKQQSKLCYEMEQLSMQRLLDGQMLGASKHERMSEVKGGPSMLGIKEGERDGAVAIHGKGVMKGSLRSQSTSPQYSTESGASSREHYLEGIVEQNSRELAELKLLLKAVLTPTNQNDRG